MSSEVLYLFLLLPWKKLLPRYHSFEENAIASLSTCHPSLLPRPTLSTYARDLLTRLISKSQCKFRRKAGGAGGCTGMRHFHHTDLHHPEACCIFGCFLSMYTVLSGDAEKHQRHRWFVPVSRPLAT